MRNCAGYAKAQPSSWTTTDLNSSQATHTVKTTLYPLKLSLTLLFHFQRWPKTKNISSHTNPENACFSRHEAPEDTQVTNYR